MTPAIPVTLEYSAARDFVTQFVEEGVGAESEGWMKAWAQIASDADLFAAADKCFARICETMFALGRQGGYLAAMRDAEEQEADERREAAGGDTAEDGGEGWHPPAPPPAV